MMRLTLLLCSAIFLSLLIGGRDYGQARFGLQARYAALSLPETEDAAPAPQVAEVSRQGASDALFLPAAFVAPAAAAEPAPAAPAKQRIVIQSPLLAVPEATETLQETESRQRGDENVRYVTAEAVNVRAGPSTAYDVVGRLTRGEAALVVLTEGDGWSLIRIEGDGIEGYVSSRYLAATLN